MPSYSPGCSSSARGATRCWAEGRNQREKVKSRRNTARLARRRSAPYYECPTPIHSTRLNRWNGRVVSVVIAALVCLMGAGTLGLYASPAAAAKPSPAVRVEKANTTVSAPAPAAAAAALMAETVASTAGISPKVLHLAVTAVSCAINSGDIKTPRTLTVIDYSLPSVKPRLWVFEVATGALLFKELVAHGRNTGENMATAFSDTLNSRQTSIGLFVTRDTYVGSNGYSLRLDGLEPGFNSRARARASVRHGAPYV